MAVVGRRQIDVTFFPHGALCPPCRQPHTKYFSSSYTICNSFVPIAQKAVHADVLGRLSLSMCLWNQHKMAAQPKEVIKEQPSYRNLSATATRVLQCTCPVAASRKYFSAIHTFTSPHLNSPHTYFC
jgi:hypothetical protein